MRSLIDWLNGFSWHQLSTIAQPWTAPVSVLGHNWPTFFLFLPVQSSLFTLLWAEFFISPSILNAMGMSIILEWPSYACLVLTHNVRNFHKSLRTCFSLEKGLRIEFPINFTISRHLQEASHVLAQTTLDFGSCGRRHASSSSGQLLQPLNQAQFPLIHQIPDPIHPDIVVEHGGQTRVQIKFRSSGIRDKIWWQSWKIFDISHPFPTCSQQAKQKRRKITKNSSDKSNLMRQKMPRFEKEKNLFPVLREWDWGSDSFPHKHPPFHRAWTGPAWHCHEQNPPPLQRGLESVHRTYEPTLRSH